MKILLSCLIAVIAITGCVNTTNTKIEQNAAKRMNGKSIVSTLSDKPDFFATTVSFGGLLAALAARDRGNRIVKENKISDPARYIGERLVKDLSTIYSLSISSIGDTETSDDIGSLTKRHKNADYILDVRTVSWGYSYFPTDWNNYGLIYRAKLRLIDVKEKKLIAEGYCSIPLEQTPESPSHDQLLSNGARWIKNELQKSANSCLNQFKNDILSL